MSQEFYVPEPPLAIRITPRFDRRKKRLKDLKLLLWTVLITAALSILAIALVVAFVKTQQWGNKSEFRQGVTGLQLRLAIDPDLALVRQFLWENLDSGEWEEVRWWPSRRIKGEPIRICRLRFRTKNLLNAKVLNDWIFEIRDDGSISLLASGPEMVHFYAHSIWQDNVTEIERPEHPFVSAFREIASGRWQQKSP